MEGACLHFFEISVGIEDNYIRKVIVWMACTAVIQLMFIWSGTRGKVTKDQSNHEKCVNSERTYM